MSNSFKRFLMYFLGYVTIFESIRLTGIHLKWWQVTLIIIGVTIINFGSIIFPYEEDDNF